MLQFKWFKLSWFAGVAKYLSLVEKSICNSCKSNQRTRNLWLGLYGILYKARMWSAGSWWRRADPGSEHLHRDRRHHSPCSPLLSLLLCQVNFTIIILFSLGFFINLIKCSKDAFAEKMFHLFSITLTFLFAIDVKLKMLRLQKRGRCRNWPCQKWRGDCC